VTAVPPGDDSRASELPERFRRLAAGTQLDLFEGALLVSALVDPDEDLDAARHEVAALAGRVRERIDAGETPHAALREVLFDEEGFGGDSESYDEPSNSSVARVLARKKGMPITLSIMALEVARLAGLRLTGVGLPGHFVIGGPDLPEGSFLDPFDAGTLHDAGGLARRLASIFGQPVAVGKDVLRPDPPQAILARVLLNLRRSYERRDRWEEALEALTCAEALEPEDATLRRERGLLLVRCGRLEEALPVLEAYAGEAEGKDAEMTMRLVEALRARGAAALEDPGPETKRTFTLDEARALLPKVQERTADAVQRYASLPGDLEDARLEVVQEWADEMRTLGLEIKGLWLVDFDSGAGYYCWKYPELALNHFHSYEEGFSGRLPLN
jgi:regulator of sirC expression with transglutaminase-like and TPR domain